MAIILDETNKIFTLHTKNTTYQIKADACGSLLHLYYGKRAEGNMDYLILQRDRGFSGNPYEVLHDRSYSLDALPQELPFYGSGDYRKVGIKIKNADGTMACVPKYAGHHILENKYKIPGLPALYANEGEAQTLEISLWDEVSEIELILSYAVFEKEDIITRTIRVQNKGNRSIWIEKISSACVDLLYGEYDLISFYGKHAMERTFQRTAIAHGVQSIGSTRGSSSHQYNPFFIAAEKNTSEESGNCYGIGFVYSGGFLGEAEKDQYDQTRLLMGLAEENFSYEVKSQEVFYAPEAVLSFSSEGLEKLTHNYHRIYRNNLCRGKYKTAKRPVLLNNWEATYFNFTGEKILQIAKQAADLGVEMLVLDDGWFGKRNSDNEGLGDWFVNEEKLGGTLNELVSKINAMGLRFGIWAEPEMVSEDSQLYRKHPDWALVIPGRKPVMSRNQLVLDFSRKEVVDAIFEQLCKVLDSANIEYLKWDMNRSITDVYSANKSSGQQGEVLHRYVLGVYDFLERLLGRYPNLLIEGCSGGGGRFDAGMLYYTPQIWCSDNTDAIDRVWIQHGTSFCYPVSSVGAHVSTVPNHQTERITPIHTRGAVAMAGSFGYELDLNEISQKEKEQVREQIKNFHKYWNVIHNGFYYRLTNPTENSEYAAWQMVSEDQKETLITIVSMRCHANPPAQYIKLRGLKEDSVYVNEETKVSFHGNALMNAGFLIPSELGEYKAWQIHFIEK